MARILVTGATGWVGSVVCPELRARGHELSFLRRSPDGTGDVLRGDLALRDGGIDPIERDRWRGRVDLVLHLAALVRLGADAEPELWRVNVEGTRALLRFAEAVGAPAFCLMSTCAVAGDAPAFSEDDLDVGQRFRNAYERTKLEAEKLVGRFEGRRLVLRMPGLVGDSRTGTTSSFSGTLYRVVAAYSMLRDDLWTEWRAGRSAELRADGIHFDERGVLHLPHHVPFSPSSTCAIVPQDWLATIVAEIAGDAAAAGVLHVVHPHPPTTGWAMRASLAHLSIQPPGDNPAPAPAGPFARFVRRTLDRMTRHHQPYLAHVPRLTGHALERLLAARYVAPPAIDESFLRRILDYALQRRFSE